MSFAPIFALFALLYSLLKTGSIDTNRVKNNTLFPHQKIKMTELHKARPHCNQYNLT